jgi:hypothetical protein
MGKIGRGYLEAWYLLQFNYQDRWIKTAGSFLKPFQFFYFFSCGLFETLFPFVMGTPGCGIHYIYL